MDVEKLEYSYASKYFFGLEVQTKSHVIVGLHQSDIRVLGALEQSEYIDIGIAILKTSEGGTQLIEYKDFQMVRDLEVEAVLEPGTYIIVPRTTGCRYPKPSNKKSPMPFKDELLIETG